MNYSSEHNKLSMKMNVFNDLVCSLLFLFLFLLPVFSFSSIGTDTTKQKYPLNDPRNPDCPCHKYQKLAEEEFKNKHQNTNTDSIALPIVKNQVKNENNKVEIQSVRSTSDHSRRSLYKKMFNKYKFIKRVKFKLLKGTKKNKIVHTDYSVCFKW